MTGFFDSEERQASLKTVLDSWLGTPWRHWAGMKGAGADCIHFVVRVLEETGAVDRRYLAIPHYAADWHVHRDRELLLEGLRKIPNLVEVGIEEPQNGDLILFKFYKATSHAGFYFDGRLYHSVMNIGVIASPWTERIWHKHRSHGFRVMEEE